MIDGLTVLFLFVVLVLLLALVGDVVLQYFYREDDHDTH